MFLRNPNWPRFSTQWLDHWQVVLSVIAAIEVLACLARDLYYAKILAGWATGELGYLHTFKSFVTASKGMKILVYRALDHRRKNLQAFLDGMVQGGQSGLEPKLLISGLPYIKVMEATYVIMPKVMLTDLTLMPTPGKSYRRVVCATANFGDYTLEVTIYTTADVHRGKEKHEHIKITFAMDRSYFDSEETNYYLGEREFGSPKDLMRLIRNAAFAERPYVCRYKGCDTYLRQRNITYSPEQLALDNIPEDDAVGSA